MLFDERLHSLEGFGHNAGHIQGRRGHLRSPDTGQQQQGVDHVAQFPAILDNCREIRLDFIRGQRAKILFQYFGISDHQAQRALQVVGNGVGKGIKFYVAGFQSLVSRH